MAGESRRAVCASQAHTPCPAGPTEDARTPRFPQHPAHVHGRAGARSRSHRAFGAGCGHRALYTPPGVGTGRGGMGAVWLAERTDGLVKRPVALKLPHIGLHGPQYAARFARERDFLASLVHANIARLYDAGITALGQPYLAMEYV